MHGGTSRREKIGHDRHGRHGKEGPGEGLAEGPTEGERAKVARGTPPGQLCAMSRPRVRVEVKC
jgi:hypothetical protein